MDEYDDDDAHDEYDDDECDDDIGVERLPFCRLMERRRRKKERLGISGGWPASASATFGLVRARNAKFCHAVAPPHDDDNNGPR